MGIRVAFRTERGLFRVLGLVLLVFVGLSSCAGCGEGGDRGEYYRVQGEAIGTFYSITYRGGDSGSIDRERLDSLFSSFNGVFSLFDSGSVLSGFNASEWGAADEDLARLCELSLGLHAKSGGAFDPSCEALVSAWGFGPDSVTHLPDAAEIAQLLEHVGLVGRLEVRGDSVLKRDSALTLNFNAVAKGWLVDRTARWLDACGCEDYLVEIGGEVYAKGVNAKGLTWRVGVERPDSLQGLRREILGAVELENAGMATSGNYRQYRSVGGRRFSHIIDPRTGYPAETDLLSASVICSTTFAADAYATALIVMGLDSARAFIQREPEILRGILVYGDGESGYAVWDSAEGG